MKKILLLSVLFAGLAANAQKKPVPAKPAPPKLMKTFMDSVSYAIGTSMAKYYAEQGFKNINPAVVARAISDVNASKKSLLSDDQTNQVMMRFMDDINKAQAKKHESQMSKYQPTIDAGNKFLAENKKRPGVKTTASGLQYEILRDSAGPKPGPNDVVIAHYAGTLINGAEFDNSYKRGEPITIGVGQVIRGWTEGLQLMSVGSKYRFFIPQELAYGTSRDSQQIPAGSALIFEVELIGIQGK